MEGLFRRWNRAIGSRFRSSACTSRELARRSPFSVTSFEAGEWFGPGTPFHGISTTGNPIAVTGFLYGGGTITTTFTSDAIASDGPGPNVDFETFSFGPGWTSLVALEFLVPSPDDDNRQFGYDNIVITVVPEPSTALLLAFGLVGIAVRRHRSLAAR